MKVHEYQAKQFFASYGLPVDRNIICRTPDEAVEAYKKLGLEKVVVKAQVHTGGRGKAVVSTGEKDKVEGDVKKLHTAGLWATMQQAG